MTGDPDVLTRPLAHEAIWPQDLFEKGIGWIIVARFKSTGQRAEAAVFLVDGLCRGVKLATHENCDRQVYLERIRGQSDL